MKFKGRRQAGKGLSRKRRHPLMGLRETTLKFRGEKFDPFEEPEAPQLPLLANGRHSGTFTPGEIKRLTKALRKIWLKHPRLSLSEILDYPVDTRDNEFVLDMIESNAKACSKS